MNRRQTKELLRNRGLAPNKGMGQNFLVHPHTARRIVELARIEPGETVLEVGVGLGALTRPLAEKARRVIGLEKDAGLIRLHREKGDLPGNVELRHQDVLRADFSELADSCGHRLVIVANLPYSISGPFLFRLYDQAEQTKRCVVMLQKEVADRLLAGPGTKEYGVPSVLLSLCAETRILLRLGPEEFHPRPRVDSAVVEMVFSRTDGWSGGCPDRGFLRRVVNAAFGQRRKTLLNALAGGGICRDKEELRRAVRRAGLDPADRAERLDPAAYLRLCESLTSLNGPVVPSSSTTGPHP